MLLGWGLVAVCLLAAGVSVAVGAGAWRQRDRPGARWFTVLMVGVALWSGSYGVALLVHDPGLRPLFRWPDELAQAIIAPVWLLFALTYTGRIEGLNTRLAALLSVVPGVTLGLQATNDAHHLLWTDYRIVETAGMATVQFDPGAWFYFHAVYGYLLVGTGLVLVVDLLFAHRRRYGGPLVALTLGAGLSTAAHVAYVLQLGPVPQLNLAPVALAGTGAAFGYGLFRFELFGRTPAARRLGRRAAIDDVGVAVAIVDPDWRVIDLNREAAALFGVDGGDAFRRPLSGVAPVDPPLADGATVTVDGEGGRRTFEVTTSPYADPTGRQVARTVVFQDVTDRERRRQRLEVLNRALRHNLRNEMTVVRGYAEQLTERLDGSDERMASTIVERSDALVSIGEKARSVEHVLGGGSDGSDGTVAVGPLLESVADRAREANPGATVDVDVGPAVGPVRGPHAAVEGVVWNLAENAVRHGGDAPEVRLAATNGDGVVELRVEDDGPGIPDHEVETLAAGTETDLRHGSGLGLWLVTWGVGTLGGEVSFEAGGADGTRATVRLPAAGA